MQITSSYKILRHILFFFQLLLHHVIPGAFKLKNLQDEMTGVSLAGTQLRVNQYNMHDHEWNDVKVSFNSLIHCKETMRNYSFKFTDMSGHVELLRYCLKIEYQVLQFRKEHNVHFSYGYIFRCGEGED